jgi:heme-dependent oxidative N-demethylase alpha subunit-like protein
MIAGGFTLEDKPFRLSMGFIPVKDNEWLYHDQHFQADIALKNQLLTDKFDAVFQALPESLLAQRATLDLICQKTGKTPPHSDYPALVDAALLVQEDLAIIQKIKGEYILSAACICFPTRWNLQEKIGHGMDLIHAPVPGYEEQLQKSVNRYFETVKPDRIFLRYNWSLLDSDALFQPAWWRDEWDADPEITLDNIGSNVFFRVERQGLQRLPESDDVLFSIRIINTPLKEAVTTADQADILLKSIETMPKAMKNYKSISRFESVLKVYLTQYKN